MRWSIFLFAWVLQGYAAFNLTWALPPVSPYTNPPLGDLDEAPRIALAPSGDAALVWSRTTGSGAVDEVWAAAYHHAIRVWTGAVRLSSGANASRPAVAMDAAGNATFVWEEGFPAQICTRTLTPRGVWDPPLELPAIAVAPSVHGQERPCVAVDGQGNALVLWLEVKWGRSGLYAAQKSQVGPWAPLGRLSSEEREAFFHFQKPLALNEAGQGIAVWEEESEEAGRSAIYGAYYTEGRWNSSVCLTGGEGERCGNPSVGIDAKGNGVVVWYQEGVSSTIRAKRSVGGLFSSSSHLVSNPAYAVRCPCVGVDAVGQAVVVFERYDAMQRESATYKFIAGAILGEGAEAWSAPVDLSGPSSEPSRFGGAGCPVLALNAAGDGVVVWKEVSSKKLQLQGAGFSLSNWSLMRTLASLGEEGSAPLPAQDLSVAVNLAGNVMAVWPEKPSGMGTPQIRVAMGVGLPVITPSPPISLPPPPPDYQKEPKLAEPPKNSKGSDSSKRTLVGTVSGYQVLHRFPAHGDLINMLQWSANGHPVSYYRVYRNNLYTCIGTTREPRYEDHCRRSGETITYFITAIDSYEQESSPLTIIVKAVY